MRPGTSGFVGQRLREVREARQLTAIALADLLVVSRQAVSQYENDKQSPSPDVMRRITEVLRAPMHRFLRPAQDPDPGVIFYRSMATATKAARVRAERRYGWLREIVAYLRRSIDIPPPNFPALEVPDDPRRISDEDIEECATRARRFWGLGDGPISNTVWLLENNGAVISRYELGADKLDAFSQWSESTQRPFVVLGADKAAAARSRYDVAHELGHLILHKNLGKQSMNKLSMFSLIEEQAHRFAGAFHLPEETFSEEFTSADLDAFLALKTKWRISIAAMIRRSRHLGLISSREERRLYINLARRRWRTKEPLDDTLPPEQPRLLRESFSVLKSSKIIPMENIPYELALSPADIEELAGLPVGFFDATNNQSAAKLKRQSDSASDLSEDNNFLRFPQAQ